MKTAADFDLARSLPSLLITAVVSAGSVIALAVLHSAVTSEVAEPPPKKPTSAGKSAIVATANKTPSKLQPNREIPVIQKPVAENSEMAIVSAKPELEKPVATKPEVAKPPIIKTLADLRADHQRVRQKFFAAITADLARRETAAQDSGDAELQKKVKAARDAYALGMIPKDAPGKELVELMVAREQVTKELQREVQAARNLSDEMQVVAKQQELFDFVEQESAEIGDINWRFPDCTFRLINVATGMAMAAHDEGNGAAVIQNTVNPVDPLQQWFVKYKGQWFERVRLRKNGRNLNVPAHDRAAGRGIIMWNEEDTSNGYWELQYRGTYYHVRSLFSGHLLSVPNSNTAAGQQLVQWPHHDTPDDQKWKLIRVLPETDEPIPDGSN